MFGLGLKAKAREAARRARAVRSRLLRPRLFDVGTRERFGVIFREPSDMCVPDRVLLYALVRGLRPGRALEIGVRWGGSARIITNAMEDAGCGRLVGIDPVPGAFRVRDAELHGRYQLLEGYSPQRIPDAVSALGGPLDLVLIDALHTHDAVLADLQGVLPHLASGGHVLIHDAFHYGIGQAVDQVVREQGLHDCGALSRHPALSPPVAYQGLRVLRKGSFDGTHLVEEAYRERGLTPPPRTPELWNFDKYANRIGLGAPPEVVQAWADQDDDTAGSD